MGRPIKDRNVRGSEERIMDGFERKKLTESVNALNQTIENIISEEEREQDMSNKPYERALCATCGGHGKLEDGKVCPDCGGTGLAEPKDERIYPNRETSERFPKNKRVSRGS